MNHKLNFFLCILTLISSTVATAAQKPPAKQDQKIRKEICLCRDCDKWYRFSRPHPISQIEEEVAQAFYVLVLPDVLRNLVIEYAYAEDSFEEWLPRAKHKYVEKLLLRDAKINTADSNCIFRNFCSLDYSKNIFPPDITFFNDGTYTRCYSSLAMHGVLEDKSVFDVPGRRINEYFEQISTCGKHKAIIRNDGNRFTGPFNGGGYAGPPLLTVITQYKINRLPRIMARVQELDLQKAKEQAKK